MENKELYFDEGDAVLSEADLEELRQRGVSEEQLEAFRDANALVETAKLVPNDIDGLLEKFDKTFPDDVSEAMKTFFELSEKDPMFLIHLVSAIELAEKVSYTDAPVEEQSNEQVTSDEQVSKVEKVSLADIEKEEQEQENSEFGEALKELLEAYRNLSPEEKEIIKSKFKY